MDEYSFLRYQRLLRRGQVNGLRAPIRMSLSDEKGFPHEGRLEDFDDRLDPKIPA